MSDTIMNAPVQIAQVNKDGVFEGYASVFGATDSVRDKVVRGAFAHSLKRAKQSGRLPALLWQHDNCEPIGKWIEMREDTYGLYVKGVLYMDEIPRARQAYRLMQEEALTGLSIGFKADKSYREAETGARVLTQIHLLEISLVTFPALQSARIHKIRKSFRSGHLPDTRSLEGYLRDAGFSRKQAKSMIAAGYKTLNARDARQNSGADDVIAALRACTAQIQSAIEK